MREELAVKTVRTMCPMNCHPTLCGMLADVEDGKVVAVRGDPENPDSRGFLCIRGQASRGSSTVRIACCTRWCAIRVRTLPSRFVGRGARPHRLRHQGGAARGHRDLARAWHLHHQLRHANQRRCSRASPTSRADSFFSPPWCAGAWGLRLALTGIPETHKGGPGRAREPGRPNVGANFASQPNTARHVGEAARTRRAGDHHRRAPHRGLRQGRRGADHPPRQRHRAGARHDERAVAAGLVDRDFVEPTPPATTLRDHVRQYIAAVGG